MNSSMNEKDLMERIARLPREIEPDHDPWDRIAARLGDGRAAATPGPAAPASRVWGWPARAVAALAVLAAAVALLNSPVTVVGPAETVLAGGAAAPGRPMPSALAASEAEYQAAFREFIAVGREHERIPAMTVEKIETGWADLRQVETALADALAQNPDDPFLNSRMLELRARQLGFLRQLASLDHSNRRLTI